MQLRRDHEPLYISGLRSFLVECKEADVLADEGYPFSIRLEDRGMCSIFQHDDGESSKGAPLAA